MEPRDEILWRIARKRADFRRSLYLYLVINMFLWLIWWMTTGRITGLTGYPWPLWVMLTWGIGVAIQYFEAYKSDKADLAEREYEKLKRKQQL